MATSIADLFVSVTADVGAALNGLSSLETRLGGTTKAFQDAAPAGLVLAGAGAAIEAGFLGAVNVAADFEHQMSGVKAVLSPAEVLQFGDALSGLALQLGKDTVFSASEAAAGIEELIKAGVSASDVMGGAAAAALSLAAATGIPVADAATLAAQAMNIFSKSADDLGKKGGVVDFLAGTANASAASMSDLSFGLQAAGTVAATVGLSFEDTATAIGLFANNGLRGSDAGTSLKTMLINLEPQTKAATNEFKALGLITEDGANKFFDATGKAKGLGDISQILQDALKGMGDEQQVAALKILFGTDAMRAASILSREGAAGFDTLRTSIESISAADAAKVRMDNLNGSMQQLGGSFEVVQITVGNLFLPILRNLVDLVTQAVNWFSNLPGPIQSTVVFVTAAVGAVAALVGGFVLIAPFLLSLPAAFAALGAILAAVALPIVALVAAGALLYAAWQSDFGGIQEVTAQVFEAMQPAFQNIQNFVVELVENLGPAFAGISAAVAPFITALSNDLAPILARLPDLVRLIGDGFNALSPILQSVFEIFRLLATGDFRGGIFGLDEDSGLVVFFLGVRDAITQFFDAVLKLLNGDFAGAWDSFWHAWLTILETVFTAQGQILQTIGGAILSFVQAIPGWIAQNAPGMWQAFLDELGRLPDQLAPYWNALLDWLGSVLAATPGFIGTQLGDLWSALVQAFNDLVPLLAPAWDAFAGWLAGVLGGVPQFVADTAGDVWAGLRAAFEGLVDQLGPAWDAFAGWLGAVVGGIAQFVFDNMGDVFGPLVGAFFGLVELLTPAWDAFAGWLGSVVGGIGQFVADNMGDIWGGLTAAFFGLVDQLAPAWDAFAGWLGNVLAGLPQFVADHIGDIWGALIAAFTGSTPGSTTTPGGGTTTPPIIQPGGGGGITGPLVTIGTLNVGSTAEQDAFLQAMSDAILAAARRVTPPPPGVTPVLG